MSNKVPHHSKRQKKEACPSSLCGLLSLPDDLALGCLFRLSRLDYAALSLVSKSHRSLVVSPELRRKRLLMNCSEEYHYVCLSIPPDPSPRWFILSKKSVNRRLRPIPSYPFQPPESSSFVVFDSGIYIIGGMINQTPTSEVLFLDCLCHTWRRVPSMRMARASAAAHVVDGKIYVFGGCEEVDSVNCGEVFDPKTQTWDTLVLITEDTMMVNQSVVVENKVYAVDEEKQSFYYLPSEGIWRKGNPDSMRGIRKDWCVIGNLLYCCDTRGRILWCEVEELDWKEVKGLDAVQWCLYGFKLEAKNCTHSVVLAYKLQRATFGLSRMSSTSCGNILVFWKVHMGSTTGLELWCAEISLERREGGEIWGKIEWGDAVFRFNRDSYTAKVLCSVSVNA